MESRVRGRSNKEKFKTCPGSAPTISWPCGKARRRCRLLKFTAGRSVLAFHAFAQLLDLLPNECSDPVFGHVDVSDVGVKRAGDFPYGPILKNVQIKHLELFVANS